ncbi:DNA alkylation repair protein [Candidatus Poribacteria bacterium]|nr:DNA alkylation repair protein [Candidatus Poribacteria bacterium]
MEYKDILEKLASLSNPGAVAGMERYGISTKYKAYGISIPNLRKMARKIGKDHSLALKLWASDIHEAKILASMIDEPKEVSESQLEKWVTGFDNWEICDQCCMNLFEDIDTAYQKCFEWSERSEEFVKRAGFVLMARLAVSDKKAEDCKFQQFFPVIKRESDDNRNYVKKAVNWALRQIGKRNRNLNKQAIKVAEEMLEIESQSAYWIASNTLKELNSQVVQERISKRDKNKS